jgi:hypothetical protein
MEEKPMQTKYLYRAMAVLLIPAAYYILLTGFKGSNSPPPPPPGGDFEMYILNNDYTISPGSIWVENQLDKYRGELNFTGIQIYDNTGGGQYGTEYGTERYGWFASELNSTQLGEINTLRTGISNGDLKLYWERTKISRLCYAQRLVYEVSGTQGDTSTNYGFVYSSHSGEYTTDSGRTVIYAGVQQDNTPRMILQNIYENMQHGDHPAWNIQRADAGTWYIKPVMRIDSAVVDNNPSAEVVRIDVINFRGQLLKSVTIKARNFANFVGGNYIYAGNYKEVYNFIQDPQFDLSVSGDTSRNLNATGLNNGVRKVDFWEWDDSCRVDFRVWWFGQVDVWFDKTIVDDRDANRLFDGLYNFRIADETTPEMFLLTALMVKDISPDSSDYPAVKYVMAVMYNHLENKAVANILQSH